MTLKRFFTRTKEEIGASIKIWKELTFKDAFNVFIGKVDIQILSRNGQKQKAHHKRHFLKKHEAMMKYFNLKFSDFLKTYKVEKLNQKDYENKENCIWICWWQGYDIAPEIIKRCIDSIKKHSDGREVVIITEDNYSEYVEFPDWIIEKQKKGIISRTHLSDILRLMLLSRYGGLWLDATFFCVDSLNEYFSYPLWSVKRPEYLHCSIACGNFATYSLRCDNKHRWVFRTILDLYLYYWKISEFQIDYLTLDYMFVLAQQIDENLREVFSNIPDNNPNCDILKINFNNIYFDNDWEEFKRETKIFKLSWKRKNKLYKKNKKTFYYKFINNELI